MTEVLLKIQTFVMPDNERSWRFSHANEWGSSTREDPALSCLGNERGVGGAANWVLRAS